MSAVNSYNGTGRLARDVVAFENADGSKTVVGTLMVQRSFKNTDAEGNKVTKSDAIPFRHRVSANVTGIGSWANTGKGDLIAIDAELRANAIEKDGVTTYTVDVELQSYPTFLESKAVTSARRANATAAAAGGATAAPAAEPVGDFDESPFPAGE